MAAGAQKNEHSEELTFGRLLKTLRIQKGLDLKAISDETKIAVGALRLLEEEAYDKLPDTVFVKGFLKAYAKVVGASPDAVIQNFLAGRHHYNEVLRYEAGLAKPNRLFRPWLIPAVGILSLILYVTLSTKREPGADRTPEPVVAQVETGAPVADTEASPETDEQRLSETPGPQTTIQLLEINAVEETWLKIIVDRQEPKAYLLNPGDRLELKGSSGFNLLIGNATGINLQLNHRSIAIDGKHGQVVTLKLP